jgi:hypothetical protein
MKDNKNSMALNDELDVIVHNVTHGVTCIYVKNHQSSYSVQIADIGGGVVVLMDTTKEAFTPFRDNNYMIMCANYYSCFLNASTN